MITPIPVDETSGLSLVRVLSLEETHTILNMVIHSEEAEILGEVTHDPRLITASLDPETKERVGLHIDNWDKLPTKDRANSSIRFAVNNGPGLRGLWIGHGLDHWNFRPDEIPSTLGVVTKILGFDIFADPKAQCALLPVPPSCGYLARTEEFLHDGTTLLATDKSKLTTWLVAKGGPLYDKFSDLIAS